jgi:hypothetical protein
VIIRIATKPTPVDPDKVKLQKEVVELKKELKARTEALEKAIIRADYFDSIAAEEHRIRVIREAENIKLIEALRERLKLTSNEDKRKMLIERYEKDNS